MAALGPLPLRASPLELLWELVLVWYSVEYLLPIHRKYPSSQIRDFMLKRQIYMEGMPMGSCSSYVRSGGSRLFLRPPR